MLKKILLLVITLTLVAPTVWARPKYSIKTMTPEVRQALDARKERFEDLRALESSGAIGENNRGYVEILTNDPKAQSVVDAENNDRQIIYKVIAQQNGLENALSTIESAFAEVRKDKAESGSKIQAEDGKWVTK
jgi:uncharacterized protein YdbL (DUF1318 family)